MYPHTRGVLYVLIEFLNTQFGCIFKTKYRSAILSQYQSRSVMLVG